MNRRCALAVGFLTVTCATDGWTQSVLARSPNLRPVWALAPGQGALRIGHRFEFIAGGDELLNIPTLTLGFGLPWRAAAGLDFTSNSEIVPGRLGGNELQPWASIPVLRRARGGAELTVAWNSAARSADAAVTASANTGRLTVLAELRGFQDALGTGAAGAAGAAGVVLRLTPHLEASADLARMFDPDTLATTWSARLAVAIPGSPHTLALEVTNGGATTLQGASRVKTLGPESLRYGFVFTLPLGSGRQWGRIFRGRDAEDASVTPEAAAIVEMRMVALAPREVRIRAGESVAWINRDPLMHTVTADDRGWGSGPMEVGEVFTHRFDQPGRYTYHCIPHPQMRGVVIVE